MFPLCMSVHCSISVRYTIHLLHRKRKWSTVSSFVPLPPPPENSKLGVLLVAVNVVVSFLRLLYPLVILLSSGGGGEPCCGDNDASPGELAGSPPGSPSGGSAIDLQLDPLAVRCNVCTSSLTLKLQCSPRVGRRRSRSSWRAV